jgi:hypothetical protein
LPAPHWHPALHLSGCGASAASAASAISRLTSSSRPVIRVNVLCSSSSSKACRVHNEAADWRQRELAAVTRHTNKQAGPTRHWQHQPWIPHTPRTGKRAAAQLQHATTDNRNMACRMLLQQLCKCHQQQQARSCMQG